MQYFSKVIVTGADGWLGIGLITRLAEEICNEESKFFETEIVAFVQSDFKKKKFDELGVTVIIGDLQNEQDLEKLLKGSENAVLFNLAGIIHPRVFSLKTFDNVNHLAMASLAKKSSEAGVKKFIAMSSNSPCGYSKDISTRFDESSKYSPYMGYGKSKMQMEKKVFDIANTSDRTNFSIVRSPWFYGPYQPPRQTEFFSLIKNGAFPLIGGGKSMRSMGYIDNLVDGLILVSMYFDTNGEVFWISDESPYSMKEVVTTVKGLLANEFGYKVSNRQIFLPSAVSDLARYADSFAQNCGVYVQKVHVLSEMNQTIACNINKAKDLLGYNPKVQLEEGMRRSIKWCIENKRVI
ncbi:NAD(P)-dependent oxidoreductase [Candidatus Pseudothioglobus singularis]|nr:NAD(P)-dependent oxidoreductase [Candidatus Pseudothioglobus singularis]